VENNDPIVTLVNGRELDVFLELPEELGGSITRSTSDVSYRSIGGSRYPYWRGSF